MPLAPTLLLLMRLLLLLLPLLQCHNNNVVFVQAKSHRKRKNNHPDSRSAKLLNRSGAKVDVFWVKPGTDELAHSNTDGEGVVWGGETGISTFVGHQFEVVELSAGKRTGRCLYQTCRRVRFEINANEDQSEFAYNKRLLQRQHTIERRRRILEIHFRK